MGRDKRHKKCKGESGKRGREDSFSYRLMLKKYF